MQQACHRPEDRRACRPAPRRATKAQLAKRVREERDAFKEEAPRGAAVYLVRLVTPFFSGPLFPFSALSPQLRPLQSHAAASS